MSANDESEESESDEDGEGDEEGGEGEGGEEGSTKKKKKKKGAKLNGIGTFRSAVIGAAASIKMKREQRKQHRRNAFVHSGSSAGSFESTNIKSTCTPPVFSNNITVTNNATFNKGITITETAPNVGVSLRSTGRNSQLNFLSGVNAGNYNTITADSDSLIVYHNGSKDTGALNIVNWSDSQNGIKLTRQLTKVHGNFEVSGSFFVGSVVFRPTGNMV